MDRTLHEKCTQRYPPITTIIGTSEKHRVDQKNAPTFATSLCSWDSQTNLRRPKDGTICRSTSHTSKGGRGVPCDETARKRRNMEELSEVGLSLHDSRQLRIISGISRHVRRPTHNEQLRNFICDVVLFEDWPSNTVASTSISVRTLLQFALIKFLHLSDPI